MSSSAESNTVRSVINCLHDYGKYLTSGHIMRAMEGRDTEAVLIELIRRVIELEQAGSVAKR